MDVNLKEKVRSFSCTAESKKQGESQIYEVICNEDDTEVSKVDVITTPRSSAYYYHSFQNKEKLNTAQS